LYFVHDYTDLHRKEDVQKAKSREDVQKAKSREDVQKEKEIFIGPRLEPGSKTNNLGAPQVT
jgi:hypothetical protein